ncbi:MAG: sigma 54-dependent Fis family transcriptional regulator [Deltaproteobacteria bacterium]|nr:sigma 54-dependent Fis family transcriptional regulator [Deltaproteobacteria bacterium]
MHRPTPSSSSALAPTSTVATVHGELARETPCCQLVVIEGPNMGHAIHLPETEVTVGSDPACDLVLTDDRVSRRHLALVADPAGTGFIARDLDSRNGTLYAGSAIGSISVPPGATLKLGKTFLRIQPEPEVLEVAPSQARQFGDLAAESLAMREVFAVLELAAGSRVTVLVEGETGTGKELAARAIHEASERRRKPFVAIDCGALPESLLESELFGHVRGAFTGASADRKGAFVRADRGTIFLDELDSVSLTVQARLLRVIEERRVRHVGGDTEKPIDVRVIAATRRDLRPLIAEGTFRPDLFYRLSVLRIVLPPLRERREDIAPIVASILKTRGLPVHPREIGGENLQRLHGHDWPGNVRELRNVIDRAIALAPTATHFDELRLVVGWSADNQEALAVRTDLTFRDAKAQIVRAFEARYLRDILERCGGNISAAAREADVDRKHLRSLLQRHELLPR